MAVKCLNFFEEMLKETMKRNIHLIGGVDGAPGNSAGGHDGNSRYIFSMWGRLLPLAVACMAALPCTVSGEEPSEEPAVSVSFSSWKTERPSEEPASSGKNEFSISLKVAEESSWKVGWCEEDKVRMTLTDSEASSPSGMEFSYFSYREHWPRDKNGSLTISSESWCPAADAKWVEVKGAVPFVMFMDSRESESVTLKLTEGNSVPLLLKGGGMNGEDVQAELGIHEYRENNEGKGRNGTAFKLKSSSRVGIHRVEILDKDGKPVDVNRRGMIHEYSDKGDEWTGYMVLTQMKGETLNLSVTYMAGFKKVVVPVHIRVGLFGTVEEKDAPSTKNLE